MDSKQIPLKQLVIDRLLTTATGSPNTRVERGGKTPARSPLSLASAECS